MTPAETSFRLYGLPFMATYHKQQVDLQQKTQLSVGTFVDQDPNLKVLEAWGHVWTVLTAQCNLAPLNSPTMLVGKWINIETVKDVPTESVDTPALICMIGNNIQLFKHEQLTILDKLWFPIAIQSSIDSATSN
jgi:hypothetical protein